MKTKMGTILGGLTTAVAIFSVGCTTTDEKYVEHEQSMTVTEPAGAEPQAAQYSGQDMVIPLHEEQLKVGKRSVDSGQVTIRKVVTSQTVSEPVELRRENLTIERRAVSGAADTSGTISSAASGNLGTPFQEGTVTIPLQSEEPVVEKTTVTTGEVVARKNVEWDRQNVQREIRREDVAIDRSGAGGVVNESAGSQAQPSQDIDKSSTEEEQDFQY